MLSNPIQGPVGTVHNIAHPCSRLVALKLYAENLITPFLINREHKVTEV